MYRRLLKKPYIATLFGILALILFVPSAGVHAAVSDWQFGANIKPFDTTEFGGSDMKQSLVELKNTGANYVVLIIPYYQAQRESTEMRPGWNTPTDEALASAIDYAHSIGLKVMLMPHLETDYIEWRGNIQPAAADLPAWYASYTNMLLHYANLAQAHNVEDFALGAELLKMTNPFYDSQATDRWKAMIAQVRNVFSGKLTYSANRDFEVDVIEFWSDLDYIGLSAYYDLYHAQNSSVAELENSWDNWRKGVIEPIHDKYNKDVVITELGYRSITGTYRDPWDWSKSGEYNEQDQANAYEALIDYWKDYPWMKGVYLWFWNVKASAPNSGDTDYTPQNKLAENVMKKWFNPGGTTVTPPPDNGNTGNGGTGNTGSGGTGTTTTSTTTPSGDNGSGGNTGTGGSNDNGSTTGSTGGSNSGGNENGTTSPVSNEPGDQSLITANSTLNIWWPGNNVWIGGVQPFKAMISDGDVNKYDMYWQVDGDTWNLMKNDATDWPHKEAAVDVREWFWKGDRGNGPYNINFVATDKSGKILLHKDVNVMVGH
jgi:hypothetical protein